MVLLNDHCLYSNIPRRKQDTHVSSQVFPASFRSFTIPQLCSGERRGSYHNEEEALPQRLHPGLSAHLNRVPGTAQRWGIAEIEIVQLFD